MLKLMRYNLVMLLLANTGSISCVYRTTAGNVSLNHTNSRVVLATRGLALVLSRLFGFVNPRGIWQLGPSPLLCSSFSKALMFRFPASFTNTSLHDAVQVFMVTTVELLR